MGLKGKKERVLKFNDRIIENQRRQNKLVRMKERKRMNFIKNVKKKVY